MSEWPQEIIKLLKEERYEEICSIMPHKPLESLKGEVKAKLLHCWGVALSSLSKPEEAIEKFQAALLASPHFSDAVVAWGNALSLQGETDAAIKKYRDAIQSDTSNWQAYYHWGLLLEEMGEKSQALSKFRKALKCKPDFLPASLHGGSSAYAIGKYKEAATLYRKAIRLDPEDPSLRVLRGNALSMLGKQAEAITSYQQALSLKEDLPEAYENWGLVLHAQGLHEEALTLYEKGLEFHPDFPPILVRLGQIYMDLAKPETALHYLKKAATILEEKEGESFTEYWEDVLASCYYTSGIAYRELGEAGEAVRYLRQCYQIHPQHPQVLFQLAKLRGIYREHHFLWEILIEGSMAEDLHLFSTYHVAAMTLEEGMKYIQELEEGVLSSLSVEEAYQAGQIASYAGVLARGSRNFFLPEE